ncbi:MAG: hotdog fold thioesterase [Syntrophorhabdaceae bacterium]|nr:hotdog fold thioesterase [Syntrophorhabdaceae bacterium]
MNEHLEIAKKQFEKDRYAGSMGIVLDELTDNTIRMHMRLRGDMLNFYDRPHGAVIYSLADAAFSVLGNNKNNISVALDCSITYHASPDAKAMLIVEGEMLSMNRRTAAFIFNVYVDDGGMRTPIATMKSVSYRTGRPIDPDIAQ